MYTNTYFSWKRRAFALFILASSASSCFAQLLRLPYHKIAATHNGTTGAAAGVSGSSSNRKNYCWLFPLAGEDCGGVGDVERFKNINAFYDSAERYSFFHQVRSSYNGSASSATIAADLASLNFSSGMQFTLGTNVTAGASQPTTPGTGAIPTLTAAGSAQAAQNMINGGTFVASAIYPVISTGAANINSTAGNFGIVVYLSAREGVDIQDFKTQTNVSTTSPPSHTFVGTDWYLQYNSINPSAADPKQFAGALFVGGSFGYSYTSHGYASLLSLKFVYICSPCG